MVEHFVLLIFDVEMCEYQAFVYHDLEEAWDEALKDVKSLDGFNKDKIEDFVEFESFTYHSEFGPLEYRIL